MSPPRRPHRDFDERDYEQDEDVEIDQLRGWMRARRRANPFINADAGVDGDTSGDYGTEGENDDLDVFIVADDVNY